VTAGSIYAEIGPADVAAVATAWAAVLKAGILTPPPPTVTAKTVNIMAGGVVLDSSSYTAPVPDDAFVGAMIGPLSPPSPVTSVFRDFSPPKLNITPTTILKRVFGAQDIDYTDVAVGLDSSKLTVVPS
jgi:hypothetical protein